MHPDLLELSGSEIIKRLKKAKALIRKGWTQGEYARNKKGEEVDFDSRAAVKFCATGACYRAHVDDIWLYRANKRASVLAWNDKPKRKKSEVLALFDKAIALAKKETT